jgi:hypothetical protein
VSEEVVLPAVVAVAATTDFGGAEVRVIDLEALPSSGSEVRLEGGELMISAVAERQYSLTGNFTGQVTFVATTPLEVELNQVTITNETGPALVLVNPELSTVTLRAGTTNFLSDGGSSEDYDAALFSVGPLAVNGAGALRVIGNYQEGLASDANLIIQNGQLVVSAADDGLNAQTDISINGGELIVSAAGDGIDSNGTLNMTGGVVLAQGSLTDASGGIDADGVIVFKGGVIVASGSQNAFPQNQTGQKFLLANLSEALPAGSMITLATTEQTLISVSLSQASQQFVLSLPQIQENLDYQVYLSGSGETEAAIEVQPLRSDLGTLLTTVNTTTSSSENRGGPMGGRPINEGGMMRGGGAPPAGIPELTLDQN